MARKYRVVERRYVVDFVINHFKNRKFVYFNAPIGPTPEVLRKAYPELPESYFRRWRRFVDAIVVLPDSVVIIEAKIRDPFKGLGDLIHYKSLVPQTPELAPYLTLPIRYMLVAPIERPDIKFLAQQHGIEFVKYVPDWVIPYLKETGWL